MAKITPIGIFDSGYGGLTVLKEIVKTLPKYDYIYLGDNARAPYGTKSFETVYEYTLQCVKQLFSMNCELVILACNTASAKALRTIQQKDLPIIAPAKRVLGVIRPTTETINLYTKTNHVGILGTTGTITSNSYQIEINKFHPHIHVYQEACPLWVPLIENNEFNTPQAREIIKNNLNTLLNKEPKIDTIVLGCTHYPLLINTIRQFIPASITLISQGEIISKSLEDYLLRHPEIASKCTKGNSIQFFTTGNTTQFDTHASLFYEKPVKSKFLAL